MDSLINRIDRKQVGSDLTAKHGVDQIFQIVISGGIQLILVILDQTEDISDGKEQSFLPLLPRVSPSVIGVFKNFSVQAY